MGRYPPASRGHNRPCGRCRHRRRQPPHTLCLLPEVRQASTSLRSLPLPLVEDSADDMMVVEVTITRACRWHGTARKARTDEAPVNAETNVRIAPCTLDALRRIMVRRGTSRDETVRQLLAEHVTAQEQEHPEDRLTHISTVLRYPRRRADGAMQGTPTCAGAARPAGAGPRGLAAAAGPAPARLPGLPGPRTLTDAVTTAIAVAELFTDDFLTGLLPLLRHGAALGLWRLAVAASSTGPEKARLVEGEAVRADHYGVLGAVVGSWMTGAKRGSFRRRCRW